MSRIAVVASSAPTHVRPSLPLVAELVRRGHTLTYTVGDRIAGLVAPTGATVDPYPSLLPDGQDEVWPEDDPVAGMRLFLEEAIASLPTLLAAYEGAPPDLVLHESGGIAGPVAAARWGVPAVQFAPHSVAWEGYEEDMAEAMAPITSSPAWADYEARFAAWVQEQGVAERLTMEQALAHPPRGLVLLPRAMQPQADRVSDAFDFVGPLLDEGRLDEPGFVPPVPGDGRRVLLVAFGTAYTDVLGVHRAALEAFGGDAGWRLVLALGARADPAALGALPDNAEAHATVPQLAVLAHAAAFVTHAGMGSANEALWSGVPTVAVPQAVDQFANADQLASVGVSTTLAEEEVTAASLRAAVLRLLDDPEVGTRVAAVHAEVRAGGGADRAADALEDVLRGAW